jgi:hypothetical protein
MSDRRAWIKQSASKFVTGGAGGWLDELLLTAALALIVVGLWPISSRWIGTGLPALIVPGMTLLYVSLPSRRPLIVRPMATDQRKNGQL